MSIDLEMEAVLALGRQGKREEAASHLRSLDARLEDPMSRIKLIDVALSVVDPVRESDWLIGLTEEGIGVAGEIGMRDIQAHLMGRRADLLAARNAVLHNERLKLKIAPGWIEFATEADKCIHQELTAKCAALETEIDGLLERALAIAHAERNKRVTGHILLSRGSVRSARYLQRKSELNRSPFRAKLWVKFSIVRYRHIERLVIFPGEPGRELERLIDSFRMDHLEAAKLFEEIGDSALASAYYNLANHIRNAYRFVEARRYLKSAETIALRQGDSVMVTRVQRLRKLIRARNRDIPNYLEGEVRKS